VDREEYTPGGQDLRCVILPVVEPGYSWVNPEKEGVADDEGRDVAVVGGSLVWRFDEGERGGRVRRDQRSKDRGSGGYEGRGDSSGHHHSRAVSGVASDWSIAGTLPR
jgi:hypothetical protein